ncbi:MAG: hypothetical protein U1E74_07635 [Paenacidovorax caeni]
MDMMPVPAYAGLEGADSGTVSVSCDPAEPGAADGTGFPANGCVLKFLAVGTVAWNERGQSGAGTRDRLVEKLHVRAALDSVDNAAAAA